jgi:hypothetical protein
LGLFSKTEKTIPSPDRDSQLRNMAEFPDLATAVASAPATTKSSPDDVAKPSRAVRRSSPPSASSAGSAQPAPTQEEITKERLRREAMATIGKDVCEEIAAIPYEVWAFMASDPELRLTDEERKKLADSYFLLAQSVNPDFSSPWMLMFVVIAKNAMLVTKRVKSNFDKHAEKEALESGAAVIPERRPI